MGHVSPVAIAQKAHQHLLNVQKDASEHLKEQHQRQSALSVILEVTVKEPDLQNRQANVMEDGIVQKEAWTRRLRITPAGQDILVRMVQHSQDLA